MPFGPTHTVIRAIARACVEAFYQDVTVIGDEQVPKEGPLLVACNHCNMTVDPCVLSGHFPHARKLHYWAKDSLFKNPYVKTLLLDAGNLPVARTGKKDNQALYASTFDVFKLGECVAVFPEGTSVNEPATLPLKDGISWTALEYAKNLRIQGSATSSGEKIDNVRSVKIAIAGLTYTSKTRYRTSVIMQFAPTMETEPYVEEFLQGDAKAAVKRMTKEIETRMKSVTVNADSWDTLHAAVTARELLFEDENAIRRDIFRIITQRLIDEFGTKTESISRSKLQQLLLQLHAALGQAHLSNAALRSYRIPHQLDPNVDVSIPTRLTALLSLIQSTLACLVRLPFFILPLLLHWPTYYIGKWSEKHFNAVEVESYAQNKIVLGLLILLVVYLATIIALCFGTGFFYSPGGAVVALGVMWAFGMYHTALIDSNYGKAKQLSASWRVLIGIWTSSAADTPVRTVLRLRSQAASALHAYLREDINSDLLTTLVRAGYRER